MVFLWGCCYDEIVDMIFILYVRHEITATCM